MIRSMTGYGRSEQIVDGRAVTVEIKSVNHRYFDVNIKMPKKLSIFEFEDSRDRKERKMASRFKSTLIMTISWSLLDQ